MTNRVGSNAGAARRHNRLVVLNALRLAGSQSRAELARSSGLTPQAIANIVTDLVADGLVREAGRRKIPRGQPPIEIELAPDGGYAIGVRIERTRYFAIAATLTGEILEIREGDVAARDAEAMFELLHGIHHALSSSYGANRCLGLGLVTPGPFDTAWPGVPTPGAVSSLQTRAIAAALGDRLGLEVLLENDATAAALGERLYGKAQGLRNFIYLFVGEGVGGGIFVNGESYRGALGNAGEFGHIPVDPSGPRCYCGLNGCLGSYLSLTSLREPFAATEASATIVADPPPAWLDRAAGALARVLPLLENIFDPETIILGGGAPAGLLQAIVARLGPLGPSVRQNAAGPRLQVSSLGERSSVLGAAALPILAATSPQPVPLQEAAPRARAGVDEA